jgi:hypothetical protein
MKYRFRMTVIAISIMGLLILSACSKPQGTAGDPATSHGEHAFEKIHHQMSDETGEALEHLLYDSHPECAELQPSGEYCEMHGGDSNHGGSGSSRPS